MNHKNLPLNTISFAAVYPDSTSTLEIINIKNIDIIVGKGSFNYNFTNSANNSYSIVVNYSKLFNEGLFGGSIEYAVYGDINSKLLHCHFGNKSADTYISASTTSSTLCYFSIILIGISIYIN